MSGASGDGSGLELFRLELEEQVPLLNEALLAIESGADTAAAREQLMRSTHSLKGAARIVGLDPLVELAHAMEDRVVAGRLGAGAISLLFAAIDSFAALASEQADVLPARLAADAAGIAERVARLRRLGSTPEPDAEPPGGSASAAFAAAPAAVAPPPGPERVVRVDSERLNRILALSGEALVEAQWLQPFADSLDRLRRGQRPLLELLDDLDERLRHSGDAAGRALVEAIRRHHRREREQLGEQLGELELHARRSHGIAERLHHEVIGSNMRPFGDGLREFPRMVRDLARQLGKEVELEVVGRGTPVDRDILRRLESPLTHILRNAIDHGLETPAERIAAGKPSRGRLRIEAAHRGGMLAIQVRDDGRGVDPERVRRRIVERGWLPEEEARRLETPELLEWLLRPGFSTAEAVTELSGRGVGLDVVRAMAEEVGGSVRISASPAAGPEPAAGGSLEVHFQLPLTLSVVRTLLVEIAGEPYALPLARLERIVAIEPEALQRLEGRDTFDLDGRSVGLVAARRLLALPPPEPAAGPVAAVLLRDHEQLFGLVVDRHLGEQDLVVRPLDRRLGRVPGVAAAALLGDGRPILILDVPDLLRSIDALLRRGSLPPLLPAPTPAAAPAPSPRPSPPPEPPRQRLLLIDDSRTARQEQARWLSRSGYAVDVAADGQEGWEAIGRHAYDLVVTDVQMPVVDGIELLRRLRADPRFHDLPVLIVSSQEEERDRLLGLEAGADAYLAKSALGAATLEEAVRTLIGPA